MSPENLPKKGLAKSLPSKEPEEVRVSQPGQQAKLEQLLTAINSITLPSETVSEDISSDLGSGNSSQVSQSKTDDAQKFINREEAIAHIPSQELMQMQLKKHIEKEVKELRREAHHLVISRKPGAADKLNKLYARIRNLNGLLAQLLISSYEMVKRFFIKVFIDKQPIL
ncbi:hypothetical protein A3D11_03020 [Candidatus Peribacteria bacterium RIFCSPHIGHO2_02_FULL_49_16]|nr:MAG: hypothetical protein A2880_01540 [Candidatus Peribacteria bacterium RIFCSPHIGHO2_01_FULL_49_38]OGJ58555.1 MAG: hypothetical protein A3D11_03020 [Candidatus Peribacteria bacterium RIFCSPHIGHO2_02_FULL_49_16]